MRALAVGLSLLARAVGTIAGIYALYLLMVLHPALGAAVWIVMATVCLVHLLDV